MPTDHRSALANIKRLDQLIAYLRDEMGWPIARDSFEDVDDLFYDFTADELGIDPKTAAKIESIKRLRPLSPRQPWGIFFIKFEPKRLPVVALRRILSQVALKKRASANSAERTAWAKDDLLFVSNYGVGDDRHISFAHFSTPADGHDLPTLKVLGWDNRDTALHLDQVAKELTEHLAWPSDDSQVDSWREKWRRAFTLRHQEVVATSRDLSLRLAALARGIRDRTRAALALESDRGPLTRLMKAFQDALVHDMNADGFADMYAQTIAYGLLSARIADPTKKTADDFAAHMRTNPFLRELMETFLRVGGRRGQSGGSGIDFDELGISDVVSLLDHANMRAVVRDFGDRNPQEDPVIHFYELFLKEYDAEKRMSRGVFYTPRPVVSFIVRSVDHVLKSHFGLPDGLADTTTWGEMVQAHKNLRVPDGISPDQAFVQIIDPATGTGTFLVEVIDHIYRTLLAKWKTEGHDSDRISALWNAYVPTHLLPRLHGYELLMAPYAMAHLKVGLKLFETGYRFASEERARIYLTNALEPAAERQLTLDFLPALAHEAQEVNRIKRRQRFTVILGNPPYASTSSNLTAELKRIVDPFRSVDGELIRERSMLQFEKNIQDDYVKFFAFALARVQEASCGLVSLISNHSYLDGPTLRGMRWMLLSRFPLSWFLDLHGNANKSEVPPDGVRDENVFDIRQGVAICTLACPPGRDRPSAVHVSESWGGRLTKYEQLGRSTVLDVAGTVAEPRSPYYYLVKPDTSSLGTDWDRWPAVCDLFSKRSTGTETGFDDLLMSFSRAELGEQLSNFADSSTKTLPEDLDVSQGHAAELFSRRKELRAVTPSEVRPFQLRAYDFRWALLRKDLLKTNSFNVMLDLGGESPGLVTTRQTKEPFAAFAVKGFCGHKLTSSYDRSYVLPLFTKTAGGALSVEVPCLDRSFLSVIQGLAPKQAPLREVALIAFRYVLAVMNAPSYRSHFADRLKRDWPRVPIPGSGGFLMEMERLGRQLVAVQLMESPALDRHITAYNGPLAPLVGRVQWSDGNVWLNGAPKRQRGAVKATDAGFSSVPEEVWTFRIGGYQICEKWLKDRKGRTLTNSDVAHYQRIVLALTETIRLMKEIDAVIERHGGWPGAFVANPASIELPAEHLHRAADPPAPYGPNRGRKPPG